MVVNTDNTTILKFPATKIARLNPKETTREGGHRGYLEYNPTEQKFTFFFIVNGNNMIQRVSFFGKYTLNFTYFFIASSKSYTH